MILERLRLPMLSHIVGGSTVYLENGSAGRMYQFEPIDFESGQTLDETGLRLILDTIGSARLSIRLKKVQAPSVPEFNFRHMGYQTIPSAKYEGRVFTDRHLAPKWLKTSSELPETDLEECSFGKSLKLKALSLQQISDEFRFSEQQLTHRGTFIDFGTELVGAVRIYKPAEHFSLENMASLLARLELGSEFFTSIRQIEPTRSELKLRTLRNRQAGVVEKAKDESAAVVDEALRGIFLNQERLIEVEQVILVRASTEEELRRRLRYTLNLAGPLGQAMIETDGLPQTYFATRIGGYSHYQFQDSSKNIGSYLPVYTFSTEGRLQGDERRSLVLNRNDESLHFFDVYNSKFLAFNGLIVGKTGSGKSVFTNLLTQSLLQDPSCMVVKIDVGGSYRKECEFVGGEELTFEMDQPSGINPFARAGGIGISKANLELLSHFVCELLKENDERAIPREIRAEVEERISEYVQGNPNPSLDGFYDEARPFPRKNLLKRWVRGGIFEHVFSVQTTRRKAQYRYYNFQNILAAGSKEFSHGIMAAVILEINSEILAAGDRLTHSGGNRIALFCDETKFFLDQNQEFFLLTTANFRKYGHSVFLINQSLGNFTLDRNGQKDRSLIINSPIRVFLQADYSEEELASEFGLSNEQIRRLARDPYRGKEFRELVIQDDTGTRLCRLRLTSDEYVRSSSSADENSKIAKLLEAVPGLTLDEAVKCLSLSF